MTWFKDFANQLGQRFAAPQARICILDWYQNRAPRVVASDRELLNELSKYLADTLQLSQEQVESEINQVYREKSGVNIFEQPERQWLIKAHTKIGVKVKIATGKTKNEVLKQVILSDREQVFEDLIQSYKNHDHEHEMYLDIPDTVYDEDPKVHQEFLNRNYQKILDFLEVLENIYVFDCVELTGQWQ
jgi:hypothetical protein